MTGTDLENKIVPYILQGGLHVVNLNPGVSLYFVIRSASSESCTAIMTDGFLALPFVSLSFMFYSCVALSFRFFFFCAVCSYVNLFYGCRSPVCRICPVESV